LPLRGGKDVHDAAIECGLVGTDVPKQVRGVGRNRHGARSQVNCLWTFLLCSCPPSSRHDDETFMETVVAIEFNVARARLNALKLNVYLREQMSVSYITVRDLQKISGKTTAHHVWVIVRSGMCL
jgi:hypothetical protein